MSTPTASRFQYFAWHLCASACVLGVVLGGLYLGWYRWPGWYLAGALGVVPVLIGVDLALGPLVTLLIASPRKPRRELARDIAIIATVQLAALLYGAAALWHGRPLYYAFSVDRLELIQASDLEAGEIDQGRRLNPKLAPHWYSRPRWVWAPLPQDAAEGQKIIESALAGGADVVQMPRYYRAWQAGLPDLRARLLTVDQQRDVRLARHKIVLKQRLSALGLAPDQPSTLLMTGRTSPLLAVFDPQTLRLRTLLITDR